MALVATAAVEPTTNTQTTPLAIPDELTASSTAAVRSWESPCPRVAISVRRVTTMVVVEYLVPAAPAGLAGHHAFRPA